MRTLTLRRKTWRGLLGVLETAEKGYTNRENRRLDRIVEVIEEKLGSWMDEWDELSIEVRGRRLEADARTGEAAQRWEHDRVSRYEDSAARALSSSPAALEEIEIEFDPDSLYDLIRAKWPADDEGQFQGNREARELVEDVNDAFEAAEAEAKAEADAIREAEEKARKEAREKRLAEKAARRGGGKVRAVA